MDIVAEHADVLQIGARNMQNFALLTEVGRVQRPVLLEARTVGATVKELLMAAEYIMAQGNRRVILCERGIRTFESSTRNTLDVAAIPVLKRETHLPVIVDPSHAGGRADLVPPLAFAAIAAGADGLIIEVHPDPEQRALRRRPIAHTGRLRCADDAAPSVRGSCRPSAARAGAARAAGGRMSDEPAADPLNQLRTSIEQLDQRIIDLIGERVDLSRQVGTLKRAAGMPTLDPAREAAVHATCCRAGPRCAPARRTGARDLLARDCAVPFCTNR